MLRPRSSLPRFARLAVLREVCRTAWRRVAPRRSDVRLGLAAVIGLASAARAAPPVARQSEGDAISTEVQPEEIDSVIARDAARRGQATSRVTRAEIDERLARSTPEALRYEPGVFIQQSAHGQASAYVRGRTGQQTVLLYDGIRLNNASWRQGPNQYLFTVDPRTVRAIEVLRGGASTRFGSDAIGGVIAIEPLEPLVRAEGDRSAHARSFSRFGSADEEFSLRLQSDVALTTATSALVGFSSRRTGLLESGGGVGGLSGGGQALVPAFLEDGRTQVGTGFGEITADARVVHRIDEDQRFVAALYVHRLFDVPRTDQCPAPFAPRNECLRIDEQFRTLAYAAYEATNGAFGERARATLSFQRQHERRTLSRPSAYVENTGRDAVNTVGLTWDAASTATPLGAGVKLRVRHGIDAYFDILESRSWLAFTDLALVRGLSRGQYIDGSSYAQGGAHGEAEFSRGPLALALGARVGVVRADARDDSVSGTRAIGSTWTPIAAHATFGWQVRPDLVFHVTADRSYRAPNLDDLTARQQSGPGFLFENAALRPEIAHGVELGARYDDGTLRLEAWAFASRMGDTITRALREASDCPPNTPACTSSWSRYQLVNMPGTSRVDGGEVALRWRPTQSITIRANASYAYGEGRQATSTLGAGADAARTVPLSRIPPLNGTLEVRIAPTTNAYLGLGLRGALGQDRLAPTDLADARIPPGGTPGFVVVDLRAGARVSEVGALFAALENAFDAAYRIHGSSINGAGRSLVLGGELGW